jgi:hypothetical protein
MSKMKRREFLAVGATAAVGLSLFNKNVRAALAAARQAGKPMLTERNLNSFVKANPPHTQKGQEVFAEAASNLDGFVEKYFHLTDEQRRELATISPEDRKKLTDTIEQARKEKKPIKFSIVSRTVGKSRLAHAPYPVPMKSTTISIGVTAFGSFFGVKFTKETTDDKNTNGNTNKPNPS